MNTAVNQRFTAKLAEMHPFKRTQRHSKQAGPSKEARGDLQFYTNNSSWQWDTLEVDLGKVGSRGVMGRYASFWHGGIVNLQSYIRI